MRQLTFVGPGSLRWDDVPRPELLGGDVIVRPDAVAMCDLDIAAISGAAPLAGPFALGHEFAGVVTAVARDVEHVAVGDRVVVPFQISCGTCAACSAGRTANCTSVPRLSSYGLGSLGGEEWGGALSDAVRVPFAEHMVVPLPDTVDVVAASTLGDNLADAHRAVAPGLAAAPGGEVLVVGGGAPSVGLWAVDVARALGAARVVYVDHDDQRLRLAEAGGAEVHEATVPARSRFPVTVDASGRADGLRAALLATDRDGVCTSVSVFWEDVAFPMLTLYSKNVTFVTGRVHSRAQLPAVLELVSTGRIDPLRIARVVDWDDLADVLAEEHPPKLIARRRDRAGT